ncbi:MAG TPA: DUF3300 domain-containing protein [Gammaproteobacteria bacterium]|nr:DUF3300 domain-containing protein [Gammaproteobacteria bacterium]
MRTHQPAARPPPRAAFAAVIVAFAAGGCNSDRGEAQQAQGTQLAATPAATVTAPEDAQQPGAPAAATPAPATAAPHVPAVSVTQASWAPDALEELLAPIALYPDSLLSQVLAASVNAQEVLDAGNWLIENQDLNGDALDAAAEKVGFGPAMRALVNFPTVIDMMCQQMDWTRQLGSAFTSDQKGVLDAVQRLRAQAAEVGNLKTTPQQTVETKTENDKVVIEVKPADPMVVYVPQYNPQVIYVQPPPPPPPVVTTTTTVIHEDNNDDEVAAGLIGFGIGILVAGAFNDNYYCHWGYGSVYMGARPFYPPAYAYRPVYGPAFRPGYGYAPPAGYRNNYRSGYRSGNNVVINNNDYYGRFSNNQNLKGNQNGNSPLGRSSYAGARNDATSDRLGQAAGGANRPGADNRVGAGGAQQGNLGASRPQTGNLDANRAQAGNLQGRQNTANRTQHVDRGYGASTRPAPRDMSTVSRPSPTPAATPVPRQTNSAFAGASASGNGSFDRAASARGHASTSTSSRPARSAGGGGGGRRR